MGQGDVLKILEKNKEWMSVKDIKKILKVNSVSSSLRKLLKSKDVIKKFVEVEGGNGILALWRIK